MTTPNRSYDGIWLSCAGAFVQKSRNGSGFFTDYRFAIRGKGMNQPIISLRLSKLNPLGMLPGEQYKLAGTVAVVAVDDNNAPILSKEDNRQIINLEAIEGGTVVVTEWHANRMGTGDFRIRVAADGHVLPESFDRACDLHAAEVAKFNDKAMKNALAASQPITDDETPAAAPAESVTALAEAGAVRTIA